MALLDRWIPDHHISEVHSTLVAAPPEVALTRMLGVPAAPDRCVRCLFRLRGLAGADLPLRRFGPEVLGLTIVQQTTTAAVMVGAVHGIEIAMSFDSAPESGGSRVQTETRGRARNRRARVLFRAYWVVVAPFSGFIRRRWLAALRDR